MKNQVFITKLLLRLHVLTKHSVSTEETNVDNIDIKKRKIEEEEEEEVEVEGEEEEEEEEERGDKEDNDIVTPGKELGHLIYQMDRLARYEAGHYPKEPMKRSCVFKWIGAVAMAMGSDNLCDWLVRLLPPLYKELSDTRRTGG